MHSPYFLFLAQASCHISVSPNEYTIILYSDANHSTLKYSTRRCIRTILVNVRCWVQPGAVAPEDAGYLASNLLCGVSGSSDEKGEAAADLEGFNDEGVKVGGLSGTRIPAPLRCLSAVGYLHPHPLHTKPSTSTPKRGASPAPLDLTCVSHPHRS